MNDWNDWDLKKSSKKTDGKKKKKTLGKHFWQPWEDQILREKWLTHTDKQIAGEIGRKEDGVRRRRKILQLNKKSGRPLKSARQEAIFTNPTEYNLAKLSKEDRLRFYRSQFHRNPRYKFILKILMRDEIDYYRQKYIETIDALDSITMQEEDLLHNMIMKEIHIMRLHAQIKEQTEQYLNSDDGDKPPVNMALYRDLNDAEKQFVQYQEKLRLTRQQRLKTDSEEKITVVSLVKSFMDAKNRQAAGDMAGQMAYGIAKCYDDMTRMQLLIGGDNDKDEG